MQSKGKKSRKRDSTPTSAQPPRRTKSSQMSRVVVQPPTTSGLVRWTLSFAEEEERAPFLVLPGRQAARQAFLVRFASAEFNRYRPGVVEDLIGPQTTAWLEQGLCKNLTARVANMRLPNECRAGMPDWFPPEPGNWELLWGLVAAPDFVIDEPLRSMLDQEAYVVHDVYRVLWEARFLVKENKGDRGPAQVLLRTLVRWLTTSLLTTEDEKRLTDMGIRRTVTSDHRFDLLCMLVTLAWQNGIINRFLVYFDGLERATDANTTALHEMYRLLLSLERWIKIGPCPMGVLVGHSADATDLHNLRTIDERLAEKIVDGLAWVREKKSP